MRFLVHEQDLLVRADIYETLKLAVDCAVITVASLADLLVEQRRGDGTDVVVASIRSDDPVEQVQAVLQGLADTPVIVVGGSRPDGFPSTPRHWFLERPFTSNGLVSAVQSVLDDQPLPRLQRQ